MELLWGVNAESLSKQKKSYSLPRPPSHTIIYVYFFIISIVYPQQQTTTEKKSKRSIVCKEGKKITEMFVINTV